MKLTQILRPDCVKVPLESKDKKSAIVELIDCLGSNELLVDRGMALEAVLLREETKSTGIGSGVAVPHGKCRATKELVMAVGVAKEPIEFGSVDGKGVSIVLLLVSPIEQTGPHIQALAQISKLMLDSDFRQKLEDARTGEEAYKLFSTKEDE